MIGQLRAILAVVLLLSFLLTNIVVAQDARVSNYFVQASVWVDAALLEPAQIEELRWLASRYNQEFVDSLSDDDRVRFFAILSIIEEMRWVLSGMVYGFWFEYRPASLREKVQEEFILQHIGLIAMGDPNMRLVGTAISGSWIEITFQYQLNAHQQRRIALQQSSGVVHSRGKFESSLEFGFNSRQFAMQGAIKDAIHQQLRQEHRLRPNYVRGELHLRKPISIDARAGRWSAVSDISITWKDVVF